MTIDHHDAFGPPSGQGQHHGPSRPTGSNHHATLAHRIESGFGQCRDEAVPVSGVAHQLRVAPQYGVHRSEGGGVIGEHVHRCRYVTLVRHGDRQPLDTKRTYGFDGLGSKPGGHVEGHVRPVHPQRHERRVVQHRRQ